ncbi:hypothetical protein U1Q18_024022, partial [Sarracenia purpurea var. burkii]
IREAEIGAPRSRQSCNTNFGKISEKNRKGGITGESRGISADSNGGITRIGLGQGPEVREKERRSKGLVFVFIGVVGAGENHGVGDYPVDAAEEFMRTGEDLVSGFGEGIRLSSGEIYLSTATDFQKKIMEGTPAKKGKELGPFGTVF